MCMCVHVCACVCACVNDRACVRFVVFSGKTNAIIAIYYKLINCFVVQNFHFVLISSCASTLDKGQCQMVHSYRFSLTGLDATDSKEGHERESLLV